MLKKGFYQYRKKEDIICVSNDENMTIKNLDVVEVIKISMVDVYFRHRGCTAFLPIKKFKDFVDVSNIHKVNKFEIPIEWTKEENNK